MSEVKEQQAEEAQRQSNSGMAPQQQQVVVVQPKDMALAYVLWIFLGGFGAHRFYLERTGSGLAILILGLIGWATVWFIVGFVPLAIWGIWLIVDLFLIPGMVREANQKHGIVNNSTAVPTGSYAALSGSTIYTDTTEASYEERHRGVKAQQRQVTSAPTPSAGYTPQDKLAAVRETVTLSPEEVLDEAQSFLTSLGYTDMHRVDNSLKAQRRLQANGDGQRTLSLTVAAAPQPGGGVQVSVSGDDREGMLEHQDEWTEWSENLPKEAEVETKAEISNLQEQRTEETLEVPQQPPPMAEAFHFCPKCGHKAQDGENFCPECGHKLHA